MTTRPAPLRATLFALALAAILSRGLIAPGWMPGAGPDGPRVVLCSGMEMAADAAAPAPAQALLDAPLGKSHRPKHAPAPEQPCAFAAFGLALDRPGDLVALTPLLPVGAPPVESFSRVVSVGRGLAAPPPPATGPPAIA